MRSHKILPTLSYFFLSSVRRHPRSPSQEPSFHSLPLGGSRLARRGAPRPLLGPSPLDLPLQCLLPFPLPISPLGFFDSAADLILLDRPTLPSTILRRLQERSETECRLRGLSDRVASLELEFDRALGSSIGAVDSRCNWTAEIKEASGEGFDQKSKLMVEMKEGVDRNVR